MRARWSLPLFATAVTFAFLAVSSLSPNDTAAAGPIAPGSAAEHAGDGQGFALSEPLDHAAGRDEFTISRFSTAPAVGTPDPGTAKAIAFEQVAARGWGQGEYECLVALWERESNWNVHAHNPTSGAYGIPQALPGDKMASVGPDWQTNPATQISWGLGYIAGRYGTPCRAWQHSEDSGWY